MPYDRGHGLRFLPGVHDEVAGGVGGGQGEEAGPYALVELGRLRLQPVRRLREPLARRLRRHVQQHRQVRHEAVGRPARDTGDLGRGQIAAGALVGDGGVDVAVGDDDGAALQGGADEAVDVFGAVRRVQQGLGPVRDPGGGDVQEDRTQPLAHRGRARLARDDDLVALAADPLGERLHLRGLARAVPAFEGEEETGAGRRLHRVAAAQHVEQVAPEPYAVPVVGLAEHQRRDGQQQRAHEHQRERRAAVREDEAAADEPVRPDGGGQHGGDDGAERHGQPDHGVQVLGRTGPPCLLGLLIEERVAGPGGDAGRDARQQDQQQNRRRVGHQTRYEHREAGQPHGQRQQPTAGEARQDLRRAADADDGAAGERENEQAVGDRAAAEVDGLERGDGDGRGDRARDGRARQHQHRDRARTASVGALGGLGTAHPLKRGARAGGLRAGEVQEVEDRDGGREEPRGHVRAKGRLVGVEPVDARTDQLPDERDDDEHRRGHGQRDEGRTQRQPPQRVVVVRQRTYRRALGGRGRQQRGGRAVLGDGPEALGHPGEERRDQQPGEGAVGGQVGPQGRDDQQGEPDAVRADHGPAAVERSARGDQRGERSEQDRAEEQRREQPRAEDGGDREGRAPIAASQGPIGDGRLEREKYKDKKGE